MVSKPLLTLWDALLDFYHYHQQSEQQLGDIQHNPGNYPHHTVRDGLLFFKGKVVIPIETAFRYIIIAKCHNTPVGGHVGMQRTLSCVPSLFHWQNNARMSATL